MWNVICSAWRLNLKCPAYIRLAQSIKIFLISYFRWSPKGCRYLITVGPREGFWEYVPQYPASGKIHVSKRKIITDHRQRHMHKQLLNNKSNNLSLSPSLSLSLSQRQAPWCHSIVIGTLFFYSTATRHTHGKFLYSHVSTDGSQLSLLHYFII